MPNQVQASRIRSGSSPMTFSALVMWLNQQPDGKPFNYVQVDPYLTGALGDTRRSLFNYYYMPSVNKFSWRTNPHWVSSVMNGYISEQGRRAMTRRTNGQRNPVWGYLDTQVQVSETEITAITRLRIGSHLWNHSGSNRDDKMAKFIAAMTVLSYNNTAMLNCKQAKWVAEKVASGDAGLPATMYRIIKEIRDEVYPLTTELRAREMTRIVMRRLPTLKNLMETARVSTRVQSQRGVANTTRLDRLVQRLSSDQVAYYTYNTNTTATAWTTTTGMTA